MLWKNKELLDQIQWVLSTNIQIQDSIVLQESNLERIDKSRLPQAFVQNADLKEQSKHRSKFETFFQVFQEEWKNKVEDDAKEPSTFSFLQDGRKRTKGIQDLYHALCQPPVVRDGCTYKHCPQLEDVLRLQPEQYTFYQGYHFFFHRMTPELFRSQQKSIKALLGKDLAPVQPHEYLLRVVMEPLFEQERVASVVGVLRATVTQKTLTYHSIKSADLPFPFSYSLGKIFRFASKMKSFGFRDGVEHANPVQLLKYVQSWSKGSILRAARSFELLHVVPCTLFSAQVVDVCFHLFRGEALTPAQQYKVTGDMKSLKTHVPKQDSLWRTITRSLSAVFNSKTVKALAIMLLLGGVGATTSEHQYSLATHVDSAPSAVIAYEQPTEIQWEEIFSAPLPTVPSKHLDEAKQLVETFLYYEPNATQDEKLETQIHHICQNLKQKLSQSSNSSNAIRLSCEEIRKQVIHQYKTTKSPEAFFYHLSMVTSNGLAVLKEKEDKTLFVEETNTTFQTVQEFYFDYVHPSLKFVGRILFAVPRASLLWFMTYEQEHLYDLSWDRSRRDLWRYNHWDVWERANFIQELWDDMDSFERGVFVAMKGTELVLRLAAVIAEQMAEVEFDND